MRSRYMTAIVPPAAISENIRLLQKEFAEKYGSAAALKPPVHVTFSPPVFLNETELENYRCNLADCCREAEPFILELKDFGFFIKNRVLFINVLFNEKLFRLQSAFEVNNLKPDKRPYRPHITIGYRKILPETFVKIKEDYKDREFEASFTADSLYLWKHDGKQWNTVERFGLKVN